ncbi:hypothetical protein ACM66B_006137 [Microbotryomycetes sp. NB124-2]
MTTMTATTAAPISASPSNNNKDLGEGTSTGPKYNGLPGSKPLSITALLESQPRFVDATRVSQPPPITLQPINKPKSLPKAAPDGDNNNPSSPVAHNGKSSASSSPISQKKQQQLAPAAQTSTTIKGSPFARIDQSTAWPKQYGRAVGLHNLGNTCYLNSALQALVHTAPLVRYVEQAQHTPATCEYLDRKHFCMTCAMKKLVALSYGRKASYSPEFITKNLRHIAKHLRIGRQEDAHEVLRFLVDGMQLSELFGKSSKLPQQVKESNFVHQIFGGRVRSRVMCQNCRHPSDTFDSILDLSLDLGRNTTTLKEALALYTKPDQLKGSNKYKCEKCKKLVNAEKRFTIDKAPMILTIHLKRFTPTGRKITEQINYPEHLKLGHYMSDPSVDPAYRLYAVIHHSGGGPHSGHYTATVKASDNKWYSMNDDMVSSVPAPPLNRRNAYILFYAREKGQALKEAIYGNAAAAVASGSKVNGHVNGSSVKVNGKRARPTDDEGEESDSGDSGQTVSLHAVNGVKNVVTNEVDEDEEWQGIPASDNTPEHKQESDDDDGQDSDVPPPKPRNPAPPRTNPFVPQRVGKSSALSATTQADQLFPVDLASPLSHETQHQQQHRREPDREMSAPKRDIADRKTAALSALGPIKPSKLQKKKQKLVHNLKPRMLKQ